MKGIEVGSLETGISIKRVLFWTENTKNSCCISHSIV